MSINDSMLTNAPSIPVGATLVATSWHIAGPYGPGEAHATEADVLRAGIDAQQTRQDAYAAQHGPRYVATWPLNEDITTELRWKMTWDQATAVDANGRKAYSAGIEMPVRRVKYATLAEAREHLARIEKYASVGG